jgi:ribosomal protein L12E/L44/L45/RPP1/RPP2
VWQSAAPNSQETPMHKLAAAVATALFALSAAPALAQDAKKDDKKKSEAKKEEKKEKKAKGGC